MKERLKKFDREGEIRKLLGNYFKYLDSPDYGKKENGLIEIVPEIEEIPSQGNGPYKLKINHRTSCTLGFQEPTITIKKELTPEDIDKILKVRKAIYINQLKPWLNGGKDYTVTSGKGRVVFYVFPDKESREQLSLAI